MNGSRSKSGISTGKSLDISTWGIHGLSLWNVDQTARRRISSNSVSSRCGELFRGCKRRFRRGYKPSASVRGDNAMDVQSRRQRQLGHKPVYRRGAGRDLHEYADTPTQRNRGPDSQRGARGWRESNTRRKRPSWAVPDGYMLGNGKRYTGPVKQQLKQFQFNGGDDNQ